MEKGDVIVGWWNPLDTFEFYQPQPIWSDKIDLYLSWQEDYPKGRNRSPVQKSYHRQGLIWTVYSDGSIKGLEHLTEEISAFFGPVVTEAKSQAWLKEGRLEPKVFNYRIECNENLIQELILMFSFMKIYEKTFGLDTFLKGSVAYCKIQSSGKKPTILTKNQKKKRANLLKSSSLALLLLKKNGNSRKGLFSNFL